MENDIVYYHKELQKNIRTVERDETDQDALHAVKENFLKLFDMIKMIMISKQDRYYGLFLMNFDLRIDFTAYHAAHLCHASARRRGRPADRADAPRAQRPCRH